MKKVQLEPAYILHHRKYRETSLLLDVFSKEHGRVSLLAKGARRNKKQQAIAFDLYQQYLVSWVAKSELGTLTDIEPGQTGFQLQNKQVFCGFYMNELIVNLLHQHEPHPDLFTAYETTLYELKEGRAEDIVLRYFEKRLLQILGYGLVLDCDVSTGEPINAEQNYFYEFEMGPVNKSSRPGSAFTVKGKTLLQLDREQLDEKEQAQEARNLLRAILSRHLGNKKLASRDLYHAFIKAGTPA